MNIVSSNFVQRCSVIRFNLIFVGMTSKTTKGCRLTMARQVNFVPLGFWLNRLDSSGQSVCLLHALLPLEVYSCRETCRHETQELIVERKYVHLHNKISNKLKRIRDHLYARPSLPDLVWYQMERLLPVQMRHVEESH